MIPGLIHLILHLWNTEGKQLSKKNWTLQRNWKKIIPCSGILDSLPSSKDFDDNENSAEQPENNYISHLYVLSQAKMYVKANLDKLSEDNLLNCAEEFLETLTFSDNDRMNIEKATVGQHKHKTWHKMRHLLVTGKKNQITLH